MASVPQSRVKKVTKRQFAVGLGIVLLAAAGIGFASGMFNTLLSLPIAKSEDDSAAGVDPATITKPLPVNVAELTFVDSIEQSRVYTGVIRARRRSELGFELAGKIKTIGVDEGDSVRPGDLIATLDTDTLIAQQNATKARLSQAKSQLDELNAGPRMETIRAARAARDAAKSQLESASVNLERRERLLNSGAISDEEYDQAKFAKRTAAANLNAAEQQLAELEAGTRVEQVAAQEAVVRQLEAAANELEVALEKSQLRAPFAGTVTRRYLDPGSIAGASVPVVRLVEQNHLEAWIGLPVSIVATLSVGDLQSVIVNGQRINAVVSAKIQELDPITRTQTVVFELQADEPNSVAAVSGQLCELSVTSTVDSAGCWIPTSALAKGVRGLWSVMVIVPRGDGDGFEVQKRDVEIVKTASNRVLAKGTIGTGDRIIVNGVHRVADGQWVIPSS